MDNRKIKNNSIFKDMLIYMIISLTVLFGWQQLEIAFQGEITPSKVDGIISLVLSLSLYTNVLLARENKNRRNRNDK